MHTPTLTDRSAAAGAYSPIPPTPPAAVSENQINQALVEWRDTVDAVEDLIILEDSSGRLRRCNRATIDFFGCSFAEILGKPLDDIIRVDPEISGHLRKQLWEGSLVGRPGWFEIRNNVVAAGSPNGCNWVHIIKDVTAKRIAEQELSRLYSVIERSPDSVLITDSTCRIEYVNAAFERIQQADRRAFVGRSVHEALPAISPETVEKEIFPHLEQNPFWRTTHKFTRGHDQLFEEITVCKITDLRRNSVSYQFVLRDVTETRQLESIAEAVNVIENYGLVFSGIRHELGNPINSVKMALTVLQMNHRDWGHEQVETFICRCLKELGRVEYLLRTLKSFSVHEQPLIEDVDLKGFMEAFVQFVRPDFTERGISIQLDHPKYLRPANCDPRALHQVLMNLLANAADAMEERPEARIAIRIVEQRGFPTIVIEDNGKGMSERQISNLFKPFYTSKPDGSGLGLVIVRKMLASMGGTIEIESSPGEGTRAIIFLRSGGNIDSSER